MIFDKFIPVLIRPQYSRDSLSGIIFGVYLTLTAPFIAVIARRLGASTFLISLIISAPFIGQLFSLLWAELMKNSRKMTFVFWTGILCRGLFILMAFVTDPITYTVIIILQNLIFSGHIPAYAEIIKRIYPEEYRGRAMGYVRIEAQLSVLILSILAGKLLDLYGYRFIFPIGGLFGVLSTILFCSIKVDEQLNNQTDTNKKLVFNKNYILFLVLLGLCDLGNLISQPIYPIFMVDKLNMNNFQVSILTFFQAGLALLGYNYWGYFVDKKNIIKGILTVILFFSTIPLIYLVVNLFKLNFLFLLPSAILMGFAVSGFELLVFNGIFRFAPSELLPSYFALRFVVVGITGIIGPYFGSILMEKLGINYVFIISVLFILTSFILVSKYFLTTNKFGISSIET
jgi:MFS family permease